VKQSAKSTKYIRNRRGFYLNLHEQLLPRIYQKFEMRNFNRGPQSFSITGMQFHYSSATKLWIMRLIFPTSRQQDAIPNPFGDIISAVKSQTEGLKIVGSREHFNQAPTVRIGILTVRRVGN
jgi:hypothetical protein